jgi:MFS transporter, DHA2 family, multidrug resistance protein
MPTISLSKSSYRKIDMQPQPILDRPVSASLFIGLFCMAFFGIINFTLSIMASPYIVGELGGSNNTATYTVAFFAIGRAVGIPLGLPLLPRIGTVRLLVISMLLFAFFSWSCAIAPNYPFFNASRFLQGLVSGPLFAVANQLFSSLQPQEKRGFFNTISLMISTAGPVLGACLGGWIAYQWEWRWVFYLNAIFLLPLTLFLFYRLKGFDACAMQKTLFDGIGYLFYFIGIFCLGFALILGQELDWFRSHLIIALIAIGVPSLLFFIFWDLNQPYPLINLRLMKNPVLFFALFNLAVIFSSYFGIVVLLSLWLKLWANYTPDWIAILLGAMALFALFPMFIVNKRISHIDNRIFLGIAILLLAISSFYTTIFNVEINFGRIIITRIIAGCGLSFALAPIFRLCFHNALERDVLYVVGLFQVTRVLFSGIGATIYDVIWQRRQSFFRDRLGSQLTITSPETQEFFSDAKVIGLGGEQATAQLDAYLQREAVSLALDDSFYLMAWILIGLLITFAFTFFAKRGSYVTTMSDVPPEQSTV